jgi:small subunit ribosomal protein S10e
MLIPKKNRLLVYRYLFKEGVLACAKSCFIPKHNEIEVPNIHVVKLMQSLKSRGYVKEIFCWQWLYYSLNNEGIDYLREYLHVSPDTVPATLKKSKTPQPPPSFGRQDDRPQRRDGARGGGRDGYRGGDGAKKMGAPRNFNPEFEGRRGGFGASGGRGGASFRGRRGGRGGGGAPQ